VKSLVTKHKITKSPNYIKHIPGADGMVVWGWGLAMNTIDSKYGFSNSKGKTDKWHRLPQRFYYTQKNLGKAR